MSLQSDLPITNTKPQEQPRAQPATEPRHPLARRPGARAKESTQQHKANP